MTIQIVGNGRFSAPNTAIVKISATWDEIPGKVYNGSGVIVGRNDVLTAAHVVYDPRFGQADDIKITISYDTVGSTGPTYTARLGEGFSGFDPDGDGNIAAYAPNGLGGAEIDFAILGFNEAIGERHGMMWLEGGLWSSYYVSGYPAPYGFQLTSELLPARKYSGETSFNISPYNINPGHSGGPLWAYDGTFGQVVGVVSTGAAAGSVDGVWLDLIDKIQFNDYLLNEGAKGRYIVGDNRANTFTGGAGGDQMSGDDGNDVLNGGAGRDLLYGGTGADRVLGGIGNDYLFGGSGDDTITGGAGKDVMAGGTGADDFDFNSAFSESTATLRDVIRDFAHAIDDIDVSTIDASTVLAGNNAFAWRGTGAITTSAAGELRFQLVNNAGTANDYTIVYGDVDRDTAPEFQIELRGLINLTAADFVL